MKRVETSRVLRGAIWGAFSGAIGTTAMDLVWFRRFRQGGGEEGLYQWETGKGIINWDNATEPGKFAHLILRSLSGHDVDGRWARSATNVVHWATGMLWGAQFGLLSLTVPGRRREFGLLLGPTAWMCSYAVLPLFKVYKPIWQYDSRTLKNDLWAHMVFGSVTALTFAALTRSLET